MSIASLISAPVTASFKTRAAFIAGRLPPRIAAVMLAGFTAAGDAPPAYWKRLASAPGSPHPGQKQIADSSWWEIVPGSGKTLDVRWFGCVCDTVANDLAALTDARDAAVGLGYCDLHVPSPGMLLGTSGAPMANWEFKGIWILGQDPNRTVIYLPGSGASTSPCFLMTGGGGATGGGMRRINLWAPVGRTTGQALRLDGDGTYQPDETALQDIKITGQGAWDIPLFLSGLDRATGSPPGLRKVSMVNVFLGRGTSAGMYADNVEELQAFGLGVYGGAVAAGNDIYVTSGNVATRSSVVNLIASNCQGTLIIDRAQLVQPNGNFNAISATANSLRCVGMGFCGSVTDAGPSNDLTGFV
jgi:hypothetical protein